MKPKTLLTLIEEFSSLPGISKKQAEKLAYHIIQSDSFIGETLSDAILATSRRIHKCQKCNHLTEEAICDICNDSTRKKILVVVQNSLDVFKFEDTQDFKPYYHVLNGLINVSKNIDFEDLDIKGLEARAKDYKEIILALSPTLEGIVTANYIQSLLKDHKVTQLAQGIPLGSAMEYVDELTLKAALDNRKEVK